MARAVACVHPPGGGSASLLAPTLPSAGSMTVMSPAMAANTELTPAMISPVAGTSRCHVNRPPASMPTRAGFDAMTTEAAILEDTAARLDTALNSLLQVTPWGSSVDAPDRIMGQRIAQMPAPGTAQDPRETHSGCLWPLHAGVRRRLDP